MSINIKKWKLFKVGNYFDVELAEGDIKLDEVMKQKKSYYAQTLITQIVRKHILCSPEIDFRLKDQLVSANILSSDNRKALTIKQGERKQN